MKPTVEECAIAMCNASFVASFEEACNRAGGGGWASMKGRTLEQVMPTLACNGIRFEWDESFHMSEYMARAKTLSDALPFIYPAPISA